MTLGNINRVKQRFLNGDMFIEEEVVDGELYEFSICEHTGEINCNVELESCGNLVMDVAESLNDFLAMADEDILQAVLEIKEELEG